MPNLPQNSELDDLTRYLTKQERDEMEAILLATPEPITIIHTIVRPDRSIAAYCIRTPDGLVDLAPDDPLIAGLPPITPEVNGGYRPGERPAGQP